MHDIHRIVADLTMLIPALDAALAKDHLPGAEERVSGAPVEPSLPVNAEVLKTMAILHGEIPSAAWQASQYTGEAHRAERTMLEHLQHLPRMHDRLLHTNAPDQAGHLVTASTRWLRMTREALGLRTRDRRLGQFCPRHDDVLTELVTPGGEAELRFTRLDGSGRLIAPRINWMRVDAVVCRHCGSTWAPSQYLALGRLLLAADTRRTPALPQADAA